MPPLRTTRHELRRCPELQRRQQLLRVPFKTLGLRPTPQHVRGLPGPLLPVQTLKAGCLHQKAAYRLPPD